MAYRVWSVLRKDGTQGFKVAWESKVEGEPRYRFIKQAEWHTLGFHARMSVDEAKAHMQSLNAKEKIGRIEERKVKTLARVEEESLAHQAYLPAPLLAEFETKVLELNQPTGKVASYWKAAKDTLCKVRIEPEDWDDRAHAFFNHFKRMHWSPAYISKLIPIINKWGKFAAKRTSKTFIPLPFPRGKARKEIDAAWKARPKNRRGNKKSAPLTLATLRDKGRNLLPEHYNWLLLSIWFGLRPHEIDQMHGPEGERWRIDDDGEVPVLWVYQSKLESSVSDEKARWKYIPCIVPEQEAALEIIREGKFKHPIAKTMRAHFGDKISGYGGRKGFTKLMKGYGQRFEDISVWMGHKSIDRTYSDYHDKVAISYVKVA